MRIGTLNRHPTSLKSKISLDTWKIAHSVRTAGVTAVPLATLRRIVCKTIWTLSSWRAMTHCLSKRCVYEVRNSKLLFFGIHKLTNLFLIHLQLHSSMRKRKELRKKKMTVTSLLQTVFVNLKSLSYSTKTTNGTAASARTTFKQLRP